MPTFYFDIDDGNRRHVDDVGVALRGEAEARTQAISVLPDVARDVLPDGGQRTFVATVRNANDEVIFQATLALTSGWVPPDRVPGP